MSEIVDVLAREILDSRGNPTVEVEVALESGAWREIAATPELLRRLGDQMRGTRQVGPDGAAILDDRGERIGVWYSYLQYPPPPRLLDDGGVELTPPAGPSSGDGPQRPGMRN